MQKADIHPGHEYALRETANAEFQRVKVLEHVRGSRWRAEWIEPNAGLIEFVKSNHLIVPWGERAAFLRDEQHARELAAASNLDFPGNDHPLGRAVEEVITCAGEPDLFVMNGVLRYQPDALERVSARARIEPPSHPAGYQDRTGDRFLPFSSALALAQALAAAEPQTVLDVIDADEREMTQRLREPGGTHVTPLLIEWRAEWALIRQWAGHDAAVAAREDRLTAMERLLTQVMWDLRQPEPDVERVANRIARALGR